jgi:OOP family OmpA-OmpF porin
VRLSASLVVSILATSLVACTTTTPSAPEIQARPLTPGPNEAVVVDHLLVIVDASASVGDAALFDDEQALVRAYAASIPDGAYETGVVAFGGQHRQAHPLAPFDRQRFVSETTEIQHLEAGTPLYKVLEEAQDSLSAKGGRGAVVIFSDGLVTDEFGRTVEVERTVTAARELATAHGGELCFHTVQVGVSEEGSRELRAISEVTSCGSYRTAAASANEAQLHAFHRQALLGSPQGLPAVSAAASGTPVAAALGASEKWSIQFGLNSAGVDASYRDELDGVASELSRDPASRLRVSGHTDTTGDVDYNRALSQRRAEATRDALVQSGVDPSRIEVHGYGPDAPVAPNDTRVNREANRRAEIELVR